MSKNVTNNEMVFFSIPTNNCSKNPKIISNYYVQKLCKKYNLSVMLNNDKIISLLTGMDENYVLSVYTIKNDNLLIRIHNGGKVGFECVLNPTNNPNRWGNLKMIEVNIKNSKDIYYYMDSFFNDRKGLCKK
jgi:hypothetical protein